MSWSATLEAVRDRDKNVQLTVKHRQQQIGHGEPESIRAIDRAIEAAESIINEMVLGYGTFDVILSGHCNPLNQPSPGWPNDSMLIRIDQRFPIRSSI